MPVYTEFSNTASRYADNPFLHIPLQACNSYTDRAVDYSYAEALAEVHSLADQYAYAGYGHGMRVALVMDNRAEFLLHMLALNSLGISTVPVNSGFQPAEMGYVMAHSDSCLIVSLAEHVDKVKAALQTVNAVINVVDAGKFTDISHADIAADANPVGGQTEAALLYTSGTTGQPKGCMISNEYFTGMGQWYTEIGGYCELQTGRERLITPLPLVHMNALCCSLMGMIASAGCLVQLDRFHASSWWKTVRETRATCLHYLGVMPAILLSMPESPEDDLSGHIKFGFGAGCDPKHQATFEKRFGFPLIEGWAMTETGTCVCILAHREPRHVGQRCIGKPFYDIEYRLVDEAGNDVAAGEPGELLVRVAGDNPRKGFFSGYYKDDAATGKAWEGGFFHTGDVVRVDREGFFYFVDRRKNIIRRSGENIAAIEVENILFQHPDINNCAVTPVYDEMRGEEVGACILLAEEATASEETARSIFDFCNDRLVYFKVPGYYIFVDSLPMTASQKIQRGEVKTLAAASVRDKTCFDLRELKRSARK